MMVAAAASGIIAATFVEKNIAGKNRSVYKLRKERYWDMRSEFSDKPVIVRNQHVFWPRIGDYRCSYLRLWAYRSYALWLS